MSTHYHVDYGNCPGWFLVRTMAPGDTGRECACESGEESLYHDGIEAGEIDESCPCDSCQADRNRRFKAWREQQEKAGIHV